VIDNFEVQGFPLEASTDGGETWRLVLGWQRTSGTGELAPVFASDDLGSPRYRVADTRPNAGRAAPAVASTGTQARRERSPRTE
jgi:hypothetical protein